MSPHKTWTCAVLCLMITGHHVIMASHLYHGHVISSFTFPQMQKQFLDNLPPDATASYEADNGAGDVMSSEQSDLLQQRDILSYRNETSGIARHMRAQKRLFGLFVFIVSLVVTVAATTVDTIYDIKGCCGLGYGRLCGFEEEFERRKNDVKRRAEKVDEGIKNAVELQGNMEKLAKTINTLWKEIGGVITLQKRLLEVIDPKIDESLNKKLREAKKNAAKTSKGIGGTTIAKLEQNVDVAARNVKLFMSWTLGPGMMGIERVTKVAYKKFKIAKIYKSLKASHAQKLFNAAPKAKSLLGFSDDAAKAFLKSTAVAKFGAKGGKALKFLKVFKGAGAIMSIVSIGVDVFNMVNTFVQCGKKSDKAKEAIGEVEKAERDVTANENQLTLFKNELNNFAQEHLKPNLRNPGLYKALMGLKDICEGMDYSATRNWVPHACAVKFQNYGNALSWIEDVFIAEVGLRDLTENCITPMEYTYTCWLTKVKMIKYILNGCRDGTGTPEQLYNQATEKFRADSQECIDKQGNPYATRGDLSRILENAAASEGFDPKCKANSGKTRRFICKLNSRKKSSSHIKNKLRKKGIVVSVKVVGELVKKCSLKKLSPRQISKICDEKRRDLLDPEDIAKEFKVTAKQVESLDCPGM